MKLRAFVVGIVLFVAFVAASCFCEESPFYTVNGYVTRVASADDFDVNGFHVLLNGKTRLKLHSGKQKSKITAADLRPYLGQVVKVYGKVDKKALTITAADLNLFAPVMQEVGGFGIIDSVIPGRNPATEHLLRADGYRVVVHAKTAVVFSPGLDAATAYRANVWMNFHGMLRADGIVEADRVTLMGNTVVDGEEKLRIKAEYDPKAVDPQSKQSGVSKFFLGFDPKKLPPYIDEAMQSRVNAIGEKLIPRYMRELPDTDQGKINFRFQLVDKKDWYDARALASGIILVPRQVVERMQNDSQLATVLADNIATVIEEQVWRAQPGVQKMRAASLAGTVGGFFVPGLGLATSVSNGLVSKKMEQHREEQSGRVSLGLMHDAGYDIRQAPLAWLRLERADDEVSTSLPRRSAYIYRILGEMWGTN